MFSHKTLNHVFLITVCSLLSSTPVYAQEASPAKNSELITGPDSSYPPKISTDAAGLNTQNLLKTSDSAIAAQQALQKSPLKECSLAKKFLGLVITSIVGVPICMARNPVSEEKWSIDNWLQDKKTVPSVAIPAGIFWAPFATVDGILLSPFTSMKHSWQNVDAPFSKNQFSLGQTPSIPDASSTKDSPEKVQP